MKKSNLIFLYIIIGIAILGVLGSSIFFCIDVPKTIIGGISTWVGMAGTVASVILSIMAMIYSNKSTKDAEMSLMKITDHYETLCKELASQQIQKSLVRSSIERIIRNNQPNQNKGNQES